MCTLVFSHSVDPFLQGSLSTLPQLCRHASATHQAPVVNHKMQSARGAKTPSTAGVYNASSSSSSYSTSPSSVTGRAKMMYDDTPCLNCGRYSAIAGQMLRGIDDSMFCSTDCGWSCLIRSCDGQNARRLKSQSRAVNGHNDAVGNGRNCQQQAGMVSRNGADGTGGNGRSNGGHDNRNSNQRRSKRSQGSRAGHAGRPPRGPATHGKKDAGLGLDGHAMFDFSMKFNNE